MEDERLEEWVDAAWRDQRMKRGALLLWSMGAGVSPRARHWRPWTEGSNLYYAHTVSGCHRLIVATSPKAAVRSLMSEAQAVLAPGVDAVSPKTVDAYRSVPEEMQAKWLAIRGYGSLSHGADAEELEHRLQGAPVDLLGSGKEAPPGAGEVEALRQQVGRLLVEKAQAERERDQAMADAEAMRGALQKLISR